MEEMNVNVKGLEDDERLFCPGCGKKEATLEREDCVIEVGEYDGRSYEEEGDVKKYACSCGCSFYM